MASGANPASGAGSGAAGAFRPPGLLPPSHRVALRLPLSDRDLHPGGAARARLLCHPVPPRRSARRSGRSPPGPVGADPASPSCQLGGRGEHTEELLIELREMAEWLGMAAVEIEGTHLPLS